MSERTRGFSVKILADCIRPSVARAVWGEFVPTLACVLGGWWLCARWLFPLAQQRAWLGVPLYLLGCVVLAAWVVRLFVIQHDAGHNALSPSPLLNQLIGHICSVFEFTPFVHWHRHHWHHHRTAGNLEQQDGLGDIYTLTVAQFRALPHWKQWVYRGFRNRWHFFCLSPTYLFLIMHRFPLVNFPFSPIVQKPKFIDWANILALDALYIVLGWWAWTHWAVAQAWVITYGIAFMIAATTGVLLFYTQHQFEMTYYEHDDEWSFYDSSMQGSMTLRLPYPWMEWMIGNINFHSLHHLKPNIPMYDLPKCHTRLQQIGVRVPECRLSDVWGTFDLALWDERRQRLISFAELDAATSIVEE